MNVIGSVGLALLGASVKVEGKNIVHADYSNLELRVLAEHSMGTAVPCLPSCSFCELYAELTKKTQ